jgi:Holliday junction resolvase
MSDLFETAERKMIRDVARRYRQKGFKVQAVHGQYSKPAFVAGIQPDVIATKGNDTIIIEVKSKASLPRFAEALNQLAKFTKTQPNMRFDLVIANPPSIAKLAAKALKQKKRRTRSG